MERGPSFEVAGVGGDEAAAPLILGKTNVEARGGGNPFQRHGGLPLHSVDHAGGEDRERIAVDIAPLDAVAIPDPGEPRRTGKQPAEWRARSQQAVRKLRALPP